MTKSVQKLLRSNCINYDYGQITAIAAYYLLLKVLPNIISKYGRYFYFGLFETSPSPSNVVAHCTSECSGSSSPHIPSMYETLACYNESRKSFLCSSSLTQPAAEVICHEKQSQIYFYHCSGLKTTHYRPNCTAGVLKSRNSYVYVCGLVQKRVCSI